MNRKLTALSAFAALSVLLSGCATASGSTPGNGSRGTAVAAGSASTAPATYGDVVGSGKKVAVAGGTYETIALDPKSRLYELAVGGGLADELTKEGFTVQDGKAAQKVVVDYMVKEFFDSTALETKDQGFNSWLAANGKTYFTDDVLKPVAANHQQAQIVLGDQGALNIMPALIHDGKPRVKNVNITVEGVGTFAVNGLHGIQVELTYAAQYRVDKASAAAFAGSLAKPAMTGEQFLASGAAKPSLKGGQGEHVYAVNGSARVAVNKDSQGQWKIDTFESKTGFDVSDFATNTSIAP